MVVERISCLYRGRDGCNSGGGKGLTKKYLIDRLGTHHFSSEAARIYLKDSIGCDPYLFFSLDIALQKGGIWLCGECFCTH